MNDDEREDLPEELSELAGESTLAEDPIPTDAHLVDIEQRAGMFHLGEHGPIDHERLSTRPEEAAARALEEEIESGASIREEERETREDLANDEQLELRMRPRRRRSAG